MTDLELDQGLPRPIDLEAFENAVHAWFHDAIGIAAIWQHVSTPQPPYPYGSLSITSGPIAASPSWEQRQSTDLNRALGTEVEVEACVPCTFSVSCQVYVGQPASVSPNERAGAYLNAALARLQLPSVQAQLRAAGIAVLRAGPVQDLDQLIEDAWVSRANLDVTFGAALSLTEYVGFIEHVHAESTSLGIDQTFGG